MKSKKELNDEYNRLQSQYSKLGKNLEEALKSFLEAEKIPYLSVYHRVKDFESYFEKVGRKNYKDPFNETEDICGIRIICYYASDIEKIENIIKKELNVLESENKSDSLGLKEFAYRSVHNIVKINDNWTATPNYRGLQNYKAEIQIRTILMHAWAEIEHKLNYKSDAQVPFNFQRKLFRLSAKFEEADEQFEELRDGITEYRKDIAEKTRNENKFDVTQDFNLDSFLAFLNFHFPEMPPAEGFYLNTTFEDAVKNDITFAELEEDIKFIKPYIHEIAEDLKKNGYTNQVDEMPTEIIGFSRQVLGKEDYKATNQNWKFVIEKWMKKLK
ncbi:MAG: (p)ppGpp synthetase [Bacteroidota bacterium]|nr:(p)ppGpp synthetase [Bacteroidota bacterium]